MGDAKMQLFAQVPSATTICDYHLRRWTEAAGVEYETINLAVFNGTTEEAMEARLKYGDIDYAVSGSVTNLWDMIWDFNFKLNDLHSTISDLNNPPDGFESAYAKIVSAYGTLKIYRDAAMTPSGSLLNYSQSVKRIHEDFWKEWFELSALIPEK